MDDLLPALKRGEPTGRPESAPCADGADAQAVTFELMLTLTLTLTLTLYPKPKPYPKPDRAGRHPRASAATQRACQGA